jgi:hypothetical protein
MVGYVEPEEETQPDDLPRKAGESAQRKFEFSKPISPSKDVMRLFLGESEKTEKLTLSPVARPVVNMKQQLQTINILERPMSSTAMPMTLSHVQLPNFE